MESYPPSGAPTVEPTRIGYTVRAGQEQCETTDSNQIIEIRTAGGELIYRVTHRDPQRVTTTPGTWLSFLLNAPWDPTCELNANGQWTVEICTPVGPGTYNVTFTTYGVTGPLLTAVINGE